MSQEDGIPSFVSPEKVRDLVIQIPRDAASATELTSTFGGEDGVGNEHPVALAVLLSGAGRTLANLIRVIERGELDARVVVVISSIPGVAGLSIAEEVGIPAFVLRRQGFASDDAYSEAIYETISPYAPQMILLAGFLRRLVVFPAWQGRILNIHPGLLPGAPAGRGWYGERVHAAVLASGATESGATVHVVDDDYDTGPVVMRATVPVLPDDTPGSLGARVFAAESDLYPEAIRHYLAANPHLRSSPAAAVSGDKGAS